jgi:hypothetical protein
MTKEKYTSDGLIRNNWPRWVQREDGAWFREWTISLKEIPHAEVDSVQLGEENIDVSVAVDGPVLHLVTMTNENPWTDEMFFVATVRLFRRVERAFGEIDLIQGQPRSMWRPFR